jgi:hypothetical protein
MIDGGSRAADRARLKVNAPSPLADIPLAAPAIRRARARGHEGGERSATAVAAAASSQNLKFTPPRTRLPEFLNL